MKTITRTVVAALATAVLLSPVARAADVTPATGAKMAQTEKAMPKRTRAPQDVTRQQYLDQAGKRFDAMDANHDGKLTSVERRDYFKKMREAREHKREQRRERMHQPPAGQGTQKQ